MNTSANVAGNMHVIFKDHCHTRRETLPPPATYRKEMRKIPKLSANSRFLSQPCSIARVVFFLILNIQMLIHIITGPSSKTQSEIPNAATQPPQPGTGLRKPPRHWYPRDLTTNDTRVLHGTSPATATSSSCLELIGVSLVWLGMMDTTKPWCQTQFA